MGGGWVGGSVDTRCHVHLENISFVLWRKVQFGWVSSVCLGQCFAEAESAILFTEFAFKVDE